jgi:hypothetical protein
MARFEVSPGTLAEAGAAGSRLGYAISGIAGAARALGHAGGGIPSATAAGLAGMSAAAGQHVAALGDAIASLGAATAAAGALYERADSESIPA